MLHFPRWKSLAIIATCLLGFLFTLPNFFTKEQVKSWPSWVPRAQIPLGLDLQGGAHLLLGADSEQLRKEWLGFLREDARRVLREAKLFPANAAIVGSSVRVNMVKPEELDAALKELRAKVVQQVGNPIIGTSGPDIEVIKGEGNLIVITPTELGFQQRQTNAITSSIETINRRVNAMGTSELTVVREGVDRILVQFPGLSDTEQLKSIVGKTAKLTFHEVHELDDTG